MIKVLILVVVGMLIGWHLPKPVFVSKLVDKLVSLVKK